MYIVVIKDVMVYYRASYDKLTLELRHGYQRFITIADKWVVRINKTNLNAYEMPEKYSLLLFLYFKRQHPVVKKSRYIHNLFIRV
jgi:hypothetical protein